jgi:membrane fusion protein (multidrug efflux system)
MRDELEEHRPQASQEANSGTPKSPGKKQRKASHSRGWLSRAMFLLAGVAVVGLAIRGIELRKENVADLRKQAEEAAIPNVSVFFPKPQGKQQPLILPGDIDAWYEAPVYGQVSGYILHWYKDYGDFVKAGDLLATIDTPQLDQQYRQALADLKVALADEKLAEITAKRWERLVVTTAVSQQTSDEKTYGYQATVARRLAAQAKVDSLQALEDFKRLVAPFDGVVTARETDIGAFVKANGIGYQPELFRVADIHTMRVFVKVPQIYAAQIKEGMPADLHCPQFPGRIFKATVATTSRAINVDSRTLLVELWAPNPTHELMPGTYAEVYFQLPPNPNAFTIPTTSLIFQDRGLQVATVDASNRVHLKDVKIGRDLGPEALIVAGLNASDRVITTPSAALFEGEPVRIVTSPEEREQMQLAKDPPPIPSPHRAAPSHSTQRRS